MTKIYVGILLEVIKRTSFVHALSRGQLNHAKDVVRSVIEELPLENQLFDKSNDVDSGIVSSMKETISSFGKSRKNKESQQFIDYVVTSSVCYLNDEISSSKVGQRLGLTTNAMAKANKAVKSLRFLKAYSHKRRKQRKD